MLGLLTLFLMNNLQDLAYLLSTLEGKGYKAYNDILGKHLSYNIIIIIITITKFSNLIGYQLPWFQP